MKKRTSFIILLLVLPCVVFGQMQDYGYKRPLKGITNQWHKIELPLEMFPHLRNDLSDIRIYGVTATNDTVEAPYLLKISKETKENKAVRLKVINQSSQGVRQFISLRIPTKQTINKIKLHFYQRNFDWLLKLEGSNNQSEWFEIADNQRILSIDNNQTNYAFIDLNFDDSKYEYYRISFKSHVKPNLKLAETFLYSIKQSNGTNKEVPFNIVLDRKNKQSVLKLKLDKALPVHKLSLGVLSPFDYYRPIRIDYATDSFKVKKREKVEYRYDYNTLFSGTLSSLETHDFNFASTIINNLRVTIENGSNQSLEFNSIKLHSYKHELVARFTEPANYFLTYGNTHSSKPNYDIAMFENKIPKELKTIHLGNETVFGQPVLVEETQEPLFKNKAWLWGVMILIILIILMLGWFTFKMMRKVDVE